MVRTTNIWLQIVQPSRIAQVRVKELAKGRKFNHPNCSVEATMWQWAMKMKVLIRKSYIYIYRYHVSCIYIYTYDINI